MNKKSLLLVIFILSATLLISGCSGTGNAGAPPPAPSGGGCGVSSLGFAQSVISAESNNIDCGLNP